MVKKLKFSKISSLIKRFLLTKKFFYNILFLNLVKGDFIRMDEKKYKQIIIIWSIILLLIQVPGLFFYLSNSNSQTPIIAIKCVIIILIILFMVLSLQKKRIGPIIGIVLAILYTLSAVLNFSILDIIVGICFIVSAVGIHKELGKY